jgi:hypothetical protein
MEDKVRGSEEKFKLDHRRRCQNRGAVECSRDETSRLNIRREGRLAGYTPEKKED